MGQWRNDVFGGLASNMAWIAYDLLGAGDSYSDYRHDLFADLFGKNFKPYVDSSGTPRIGPALDLELHLATVATAITGAAPDAALLARLGDVVGRTYEAGASKQLQNRLDQVFKDWASENGLADFPRSFVFANEGEVKSALSTVLANIESTLSVWQKSGIPLSEERAVIASLAYGGYDTTTIMDAMVLGGERIAPWIDIRYRALSEDVPPSQLNTVAARGYYQSAQFELYNDPDNVGYDEAVDVGQVYNNERSRILSYERDFNPTAIGLKKEGGRDGIADFLQPAIETLAQYYGAEVGRAEELLFASGRSPEFYGDNPADDFNSKKNDDDFIISTLSLPVTIFGGAGDDVIVALAGPDRLEGGAGNDNLYGGTGADTLLGSAGNDKLWGGGGSDQLEGGTGNDTYILGGDEELDPTSGGSPSQVGASSSDVIVEGKNAGIDTLVVQVNSGTFNLRHVEKFQLSDTMAGTASVNLNEFKSFTLSGGDDDLTLVINRLQKAPIEIATRGGSDTVHIQFEPGVDPSQVLDGKGMTARFSFKDLTASDTIDLTSIGIKQIIAGRDRITEDTGFYLLAPGAKLDLMDGGKIDKTYNNYTDNWFVVKCGDDTPFGPEFIGNIDRTHFDI